MATYIDGKLITNTKRALGREDLTFQVNQSISIAGSVELILDEDYSLIEFYFNSSTQLNTLHPYSKQTIGGDRAFLPVSNPSSSGGPYPNEYGSSSYPIQQNPPFQSNYKKYAFEKPPRIIGFYNFSSYALTGVNIVYRAYK